MHLIRRKNIHKHGIKKKTDLSKKPVGIGAVHDASFMGQPGEGSQFGYAILVAPTELYDGPTVTHLVDWNSAKIHRKVRSTLAAEAASCSRAYDRSMYARAMMSEIENGKTGHWTKMCADVPFCLGTDCRSLYDLCQKLGSLPDERRVALDLLDVKEGIEEMSDEIRWVPTDHMLVDPFTKSMPPDLLMRYLQTGKYSFKYDDDIKNTKRVVAKERKVIKSEKSNAKKEEKQKIQSSELLKDHKTARSEFDRIHCMSKSRIWPGAHATVNGKPHTPTNFRVPVGGG